MDNIEFYHCLYGQKLEDNLIAAGVLEVLPPDHKGYGTHILRFAKNNPSDGCPVCFDDGVKMFWLSKSREDLNTAHCASLAVPNQLLIYTQFDKDFRCDCGRYLKNGEKIADMPTMCYCDTLKEDFREAIKILKKTGLTDAVIELTCLYKIVAKKKSYGKTLNLIQTYVRMTPRENPKEGEKHEKSN